MFNRRDILKIGPVAVVLTLLKGPATKPEVLKPPVEVLVMGFEVVLLNNGIEEERAGRIPFKVKSTPEGFVNAEDIFFKEAQLPYHTNGFRIYHYGRVFHEAGVFPAWHPICIGDTVCFTRGALKITLG